MYKAAKETIEHTKRHQQNLSEQNDPEITQKTEAKRKPKIEY